MGKAQENKFQKETGNKYMHEQLLASMKESRRNAYPNETEEENTKYSRMDYFEHIRRGKEGEKKEN